MPNPEFSSLEHPSAAKLQLLGDEGLWTPALTASTGNPDLGTGATTDGFRWRNGNEITATFDITFGTGASAGTGDYSISLPAGLGADYAAMPAVPCAIGQVFLLDSGTTQTVGTCVLVAGDLVQIYAASAVVGAASPWAWADGDRLAGTVTYRSDIA